MEATEARSEIVLTPEEMRLVALEKLELVEKKVIASSMNDVSEAQKLSSDYLFYSWKFEDAALRFVNQRRSQMGLPQTGRIPAYRKILGLAQAGDYTRVRQEIFAKAKKAQNDKYPPHRIKNIELAKKLYLAGKIIELTGDRYNLPSDPWDDDRETGEKRE